jgi:hypothetical protein
MLRSTIIFAQLAQKKAGAATALAGVGSQGTANKLQTDERFAQAAIEYLYEWNPPNDSNKRTKDIVNEQKASEAYDRYMALLDKRFNERTDRLVARMNEALDACPDELLEEATLFNSQSPPLAFRLPKQSPPIPGFEPAFGLDVPQLRLGQMEEMPLKRLTDHMQLEAIYQNENARMDGKLPSFDDDEDNNDNNSAAGVKFAEPPANAYPFVDSSEVRSVLTNVSGKLEELHGTMRQNVPLTGTSGEEWETHCALQRRAFARQQLILDLSENLELQEKYNSEEGFAERELERRGILPLEEEDTPAEFDVEQQQNQGRILPRPLPELHYAQFPKYHPFRSE